MLRLVQIELLILSLFTNIYFRKIFPPKLGPAELNQIQGVCHQPRLDVKVEGGITSQGRAQVDFQDPWSINLASNDYFRFESIRTSKPNSSKQFCLFGSTRLRA
jgi:hypothetical protein